MTTSSSRVRIGSLHPGRIAATALSALLLLVAGCHGPGASRHTDSVTSSSREQWQRWRVRRLESIGGINGWAALAGLHWLVEGTNTAGTHSSNQIVLQPRSLPQNLGRFIRNGKAVRFESTSPTEVLADGSPVTTVALQPDIPGPATLLTVGSVRMNLINRGEDHERLGIRVRDPASPARQAFHGIECFAYDPAWRLTARFEPYPMPRQVRLDDVTGGTQIEVSPGVVVFETTGQTHRLEVLEDDEEGDFFILFRDTTAGKTTYGSGRFLHVPHPDAAARVTMDFNFAYNPPCAYTAYATCPLPPRQNRLPLAIPAGERFTGEHPSHR